MAGLSIPQAEKGYQAVVAPWWPILEDEETPELQWPSSVEVYDRMRRQDAQVISVLRAVSLPLRRAEWYVDPNGASDEVTRFVASELGLPVKGADPSAPLARTRDRFSWDEHLRLALLCLPFGHAYFEQVYRYDPATGHQHLRKLAWRPPRTIQKVDVASDGGLVAIEQKPTTTNAPPRIGVESLVAYVNDREGGNWLGQSLLRPAYKFWLLKDRLLRVQAQTVDRNGMGVPVYEASQPPEGMSDADLRDYREKEQAAGLQIATGLRSGENSGAAIPYGANLNMKGVIGQLPDADKPIRYYDEQIARAVLAHFLNLGTETGSWALGSTFADFFTMSLQTVAKQVAAVTTQHVVEDLVDINFGVGVPAPQISFDEIGTKHQVTAEAISALISCGALLPEPKLESFLRESFGLPQKAPLPASASSPVTAASNLAARELRDRVESFEVLIRNGLDRSAAAAVCGLTEHFKEGS